MAKVFLLLLLASRANVICYAAKYNTLKVQPQPGHSRPSHHVPRLPSFSSASFGASTVCLLDVERRTLKQPTLTRVLEVK
jgi:hypothetical protein